jgi:hypothetical protein
MKPWIIGIIASRLLLSSFWTSIVLYDVQPLSESVPRLVDVNPINVSISRSDLKCRYAATVLSFLWILKDLPEVCLIVTSICEISYKEMIISFCYQILFHNQNPGQEDGIMIALIMVLVSN